MIVRSICKETIDTIHYYYVIIHTILFNVTFIQY